MLTIACGNCGKEIQEHQARVRVGTKVFCRLFCKIQWEEERPALKVYIQPTQPYSAQIVKG